MHLVIFRQIAFQKSPSTHLNIPNRSIIVASHLLGDHIDIQFGKSFGIIANHRRLLQIIGEGAWSSGPSGGSVQGYPHLTSQIKLHNPLKGLCLPLSLHDKSQNRGSSYITQTPRTHSNSIMQTPRTCNNSKCTYMILFMAGV